MTERQCRRQCLNYYWSSKRVEGKGCWGERSGTSVGYKTILCHFAPACARKAAAIHCVIAQQPGLTRKPQSNVLNRLQLLTFWMALFHTRVCCFHLNLGLMSGRDPGSRTGLSPALSCGARLAKLVCVAPRARGPVMGYLNRHSHDAEKWW